MSEKIEYPSSQIDNTYIPKDEMEKERFKMVQKMIGVLGETDKTLFKKKQEERLQILKENLETIFSKDYSILGHGTSIDIATEIIKSGLKARSNDLNSTAIPLFTSTENNDECFKTILNWPHRNYKGIVVIAIPNPQEGERGGLSYFNSVFEELEDDEKIEVGVQGADKSYYIPPKFIKGYINVNSLNFIENENYNPSVKPIIKRKKTEFRPPIRHNENIPEPVILNNNEIEDAVW